MATDKTLAIKNRVPDPPSQGTAAEPPQPKSVWPASAGTKVNPEREGRRVSRRQKRLTVADANRVAKHMDHLANRATGAGRLSVVDGVGPHPSATGTGDAGRVPDRVTGPGNGSKDAA